MLENARSAEWYRIEEADGTGCGVRTQIYTHLRRWLNPGRVTIGGFIQIAGTGMAWFEPMALKCKAACHCGAWTLLLWRDLGKKHCAAPP